MSNMTTEQLQRLTDLINARYNEFSVGNTPIFESLTLGNVRLILAAVEEWRDEPRMKANLDFTPDSAIGRENPPGGSGVTDEDDDLVELQDEPEPGKPKPEISDARRAWLERRKASIAAKGHGRTRIAESEVERKQQRNTVLPTLQEVVAELRRTAMAGVMPTMAQFAEARPATWATAQAHALRLNMTWPQLAAEAGLNPRRSGPQPQNGTGTGRDKRHPEGSRSEQA
jgi:hypothetical protein